MRVPVLIPVLALGGLLAACGDGGKPQVSTTLSESSTTSIQPTTTTADTALIRKARSVVLTVDDLPAFREAASTTTTTPGSATTTAPGSTTTPGSTTDTSISPDGEIDLSGCPAPANERLQDNPAHVDGPELERGQGDDIVSISSSAVFGAQEDAEDAIAELEQAELAECLGDVFAAEADTEAPPEVAITRTVTRSEPTVSDIDQAAQIQVNVTFKGPAGTLEYRIMVVGMREGDGLAYLLYSAPSKLFQTAELRNATSILARKLATARAEPSTSSTSTTSGKSSSTTSARSSTTSARSSTTSR